MREGKIMDRQKLYGLIGLQPEVVCRLQAIGVQTDWNAVEPYLARMTERETAAMAYRELKDALVEDADNMKMLCCQLECAGRIYDRYRQKGIAESVYADTMKCFTRFLDECGKKNGRMFFDRGWWTYRQVSMSLFRIGTLEYEFDTYEAENVIAVHIPSDADLSKEAVDRSLGQAESFFRTYYPGYAYDNYTCDSWLMSPVLRRLLPGTSNIAAFQDRFRIIDTANDREYIEWLFQVPEHTAYEELPERTSLQRKVKALLLDGGSVGSAFGVMAGSRITQE